MAEETDRRTRVGHLNLDGDYKRLLPAAFDDTERGGVLLRVPYLIGKFPERWFFSDLGLYIGPDGKAIQRESPPSELDYFDEKGSVGLVGCRPGGGGSTRFGGMAASSGVGTIAASYAVEKAEHASNYAKINGLRSEIDGLDQWLNLWAHRTTVTFPQDGKPMAVSTTMEVPADVRLGSKLNVCATVIGTAPSTQQSEVRYTSTAKLQTYSKTARNWDEHLRLHRAIRDLLRVAYWRPAAFRAHEVTSDSEKTVIRDGDVRHSRWCPMRTSLTGISKSVWDLRAEPLFVFSDVRSTGISKWLALSDKNIRGLQPFLRLLDIRQGTLDEHMTQLGIAIEALGYQAFRDDGASEKRSDGKTIEQRVRKIAGAVAACVPDVSASFPKDFADGYNAVKHANRPQADPADLVRTYRLGVIIVRAWVALRIGVSENVVRKRLQ